MKQKTVDKELCAAVGRFQSSPYFLFQLRASGGADSTGAEIYEKETIDDLLSAGSLAGLSEAQWAEMKKADATIVIAQKLGFKPDEIGRYGGNDKLAKVMDKFWAGQPQADVTDEAE